MDLDSGGFSEIFMYVANAVETALKKQATHLALTALSSFAIKQQPNASIDTHNGGVKRGSVPTSA